MKIRNMLMILMILAVSVSYVFAQSTNSVNACTMDAMMCPDGSYVGRTGPDCEFVCPEQITACTEEAKICPDGSSVGRTGPNCEFAECDDDNSTISNPDCPQYSPPGPDFCPGGVIVAGKPSVSGCQGPPRCEPTNTIACTMDAMMCPDGSYVGRTGPDCEFVCSGQTGGVSGSNSGDDTINDGTVIRMVGAGSVSIENSEIYMNTSDGKKSIKILPMQAASISKSNVSDVEIKEDGKEVIYVVRGQKQARVFGLFSTTVTVETKINAQTGEVISTKKPWWATIVKN